MMIRYPVKLTPDTNGTFLVTAPDFPELKTFGEDRPEALMRAADALEEAIAGRIARREDVPAPSKGRVFADLPSSVAIKVAIYRAMREQHVTKADLGRRLRWQGPMVDRILDLNHASRLDQLDAAMAALGLRLGITAEPA